MVAFPFMPGVPAAGHVTGRGFWHPGRQEGCVKCVPPVLRVQPDLPARNRPAAPVRP